MSKADLARRVGVCRAYVKRLEKGDLQPSGEVMFRIAEYFKCRVEDVFQRVPESGKPSLVGSQFVTSGLVEPVRNSQAAPSDCPTPTEKANAKSLGVPALKIVAPPVGHLSHWKRK